MTSADLRAWQAHMGYTFAQAAQALGMTSRQAAAKYGVWPSTASDALSGRTWPERSFFTGLIAANRPWSQRA